MENQSLCCLLCCFKTFEKMIVVNKRNYSRIFSKHNDIYITRCGYFNTNVLSVIVIVVPDAYWTKSKRTRQHTKIRSNDWGLPKSYICYTISKHRHNDCFNQGNSDLDGNHNLVKGGGMRLWRENIANQLVCKNLPKFTIFKSRCSSP